MFVTVKVFNTVKVSFLNLMKLVPTDICHWLAGQKARVLFFKEISALTSICRLKRNT